MTYTLKELFEKLDSDVFLEVVRNVTVVDKDDELGSFTVPVREKVDSVIMKDYIIKTLSYFRMVNGITKLNLDKLVCYYVDNPANFGFDFVIEIDNTPELTLEEMIDEGYTFKQIQKILKERKQNDERKGEELCI